MTAKKPARARQRVAPPDDDGPQFRTVWKWFTGIASFVVGSAFIAAFAWLWNTNSDLTKIAGKVDVNTEILRDLATMPTTQATQAQQIINLQQLQSSANLTLADRMNTIAKRLDDMEREARWRDRMGSGSGVSRRQ